LYSIPMNYWNNSGIVDGLEIQCCVAHDLGGVRHLPNQAKC
jgi:hypothetical protein